MLPARYDDDDDDDNTTPILLQLLLRCSGCPRDIMAKALNCGIVVSGFELQSHYCVYFLSDK